MNTKMKKVYIQIVDTLTKSHQTGMIEESIQKGFEIANAIGHFGININSVRWLNEESTENWKMKSGIVEGSYKLINVIITN